MREKALQDIIKFLNKLGYFELISNPDKLENFIQNLTPEQVKNLKRRNNKRKSI